VGFEKRRGGSLDPPARADLKVRPYGKLVSSQQLFMVKHTIEYKKYTRKLSPRLKDFDYRGYYVYFITCNTYKNEDYFKDGKAVGKIIDILRNAIREHKFRLICYCFMPDHLHLLVRGINETSSLETLMKSFKQETAYYFKKYSNKILWERSYFDHTVRKIENVSNICDYILHNPIRKGIVQDCEEYPYSYVHIKDEISIGQT